jgi:hypothetical protein
MFWSIGATGLRIELDPPNSQRQRNQMINFVVSGLVLCDSILGVCLPLKPSWYRSYLFSVAGNANVLRSYVECVTGC